MSLVTSRRCATCNSQKSNKDNTNFKKVLESYELRKKGCIFVIYQKIE